LQTVDSYDIPDRYILTLL